MEKKFNNNLHFHLKRLLIISIAGIIFSFLLIIDYLVNKNSLSEIVLSLGLFIFSIFFLIKRKELLKIANNKR